MEKIYRVTVDYGHAMLLGINPARKVYSSRSGLSQTWHVLSEDEPVLGYRHDRLTWPLPNRFFTFHGHGTNPKNVVVCESEDGVNLSSAKIGESEERLVEARPPWWAADQEPIMVHRYAMDDLLWGGLRHREENIFSVPKRHGVTIDPKNVLDQCEDVGFKAPFIKINHQYFRDDEYIYHEEGRILFTPEKYDELEEKETLLHAIDCCIVYEIDYLTPVEIIGQLGCQIVKKYGNVIKCGCHKVYQGRGVYEFQDQELYNHIETWLEQIPKICEEHSIEIKHLKDDKEEKYYHFSW